MGKNHLRKLMQSVKADLVREDGRLERHCEHGIGHTVGHIRGYLKGPWEDSHGCDGCCVEWKRMEIWDKKPKTDEWSLPTIGDFSEPPEWER